MVVSIYNNYLFLSPNRSDSSVTLSENDVSLGDTSSSSKADSEPHGEGSSLEEKNGGKNAGAETESGLDQGVGDDNVPLS